MVIAGTSFARLVAFVPLELAEEARLASTSVVADVDASDGETAETGMGEMGEMGCVVAGRAVGGGASVAAAWAEENWSGVGAWSPTLAPEPGADEAGRWNGASLNRPRSSSRSYARSRSRSRS